MSSPWPTRGLFPVLCLGFLVAPPTLQAGPLFGEEMSLDPGIPSPESVLGYPVGGRLTPHHRLAAYVSALAQASDRVLLEEYGRTPEGRPLLLLTVSTPENLGRRDAIRDGYARLADPRSLSGSEAEALCQELPVAVWLSFNIHGDESSSSEAAMALAYRLAADRSPEMAELLGSSVILIDPCLNPDGRARYVNWYNGVVGQRADPLPTAREHHQPWPGGRYNHYLFDLNRDWAWLVQDESRYRATVYLTWRPQVHVDFHEMWADATYFFFPPERPIHTLYPPEVEQWAGIFGRGNAAAFDARGWRYYTAESFDLYYPGYGDSWPTFHGAIGMTYEQAGHGFAGTALTRAGGDTLTLSTRAEHHYTAALATVRTASAHRVDRLRDFHRFFRSDRHSGPGAYWFPPGGDPPRTARLVDLLMRHGAEVHRTTGETRPRGLHDYDGGEVSRSLPAGTFVVSMDQPLHRFLGAILEPEAALPDTFFYDVSAWSLPLAFGIEAYWSEGAPGSGLEALDSPPAAEGRLIHREAGYAYAISWERNQAALAAGWLLEHGVALHFTNREFRSGGFRFPAGSLIAFRNGNPSELPDLMEQVTSVAAVEVVGLDSGLTESGPDLGSHHVQKLVKPRVGLVIGDAAMPTSVGACWFLLDREYRIPHSLVRLEDLDRSDLDRYTVLVIPDDGAGGLAYGARIDSTTVAMLRDWVEAGGVLVGLGGGAFFAASERAGLTTVREAALEDEAEDLSEEEKETRQTALAQETLSERERRERLDRVPGTIFRVTVDPQHPLAFGYGGEARVLKISDRALELGPPGTNVAWFSELGKISGYAPETAVAHLEDTPFLVDEPRGRGHVVLYVEDPNFRLFWYGLNRLFLNSLFFLSRPR